MIRRHTHGHERPSLRWAAVGLVVALAAGLGGWFVAERIAADPAAVPSVQKELAAGPARLKVSQDWAEVRSPPIFPGLAGAPAWTPYSGLATTVSVALVPADDAGWSRTSWCAAPTAACRGPSAPASSAWRRAPTAACAQASPCSGAGEDGAGPGRHLAARHRPRVPRPGRCRRARVAALLGASAFRGRPRRAPAQATRVRAFLDGSASRERAAERDLVGVLEVAADGQA